MRLDESVLKTDALSYHTALWRLPVRGSQQAWASQQGHVGWRSGKEKAPPSSLCSYRLDVSRAVSGPHLPDLMALTLKPTPPLFFFLVGQGFSLCSKLPPHPSTWFLALRCVRFPGLGGSGVLTGRHREAWDWTGGKAIGGAGGDSAGLGSVADAHGTAQTSSD